MINSSYLTQEQSSPQTRLKDFMLVLGVSLLIGLFAQISIPLPFTPVPLIVYSQVILMLSVILGSQRALAAVCLFLIEGALGLPVFSGGTAGFARLLSPVGGYLIGFAAAAFVTGWIAERLKQKTKMALFTSMAIGNLIIFALGVLWLSTFLGWTGAVLCGFIPFVIGDILKLSVATVFLSRYFSK
ncbi:MAG: hypothetical protein RLZZ453_610 [Chlamydiota bacterium]|jgi:biotin transport system substrate-specific component